MKTKTLLTLFVLLSAVATTSFAQGLKIVHQACEQTIVKPTADGGRYLWLPIQESAPEGRVCVLIGQTEMMAQNVRMARENVDYYLALDLKPWLNNKNLNVVVQNVPQGMACFKHMAQNNDTQYKMIAEPHRPLFHHTPERGWMNDPNGMFYLDGVWHLYYQYNPYGSMWGNMHWAHSTSKDLVNWEHHPIALAPDAWGTMFSGSCVVDHNNTAGFGKDAVIALYTSSRPTPFGGDVQAQCLAYSTDGGYTFTKYDGNPILTAPEKDFRDPNMFWNEDINAWNLILAVGQEMRIYSSPNLKEWKEESRFGREYGAHGGVWECPDLMKIDGKWVLVCNINPGGPFGGSATQYFVGSFDGHKFVCEDEPTETKWMDYGRDHYATVSFSNTPDNRRTVIAWMSNWDYADRVPTKQFRSANSVSRDLFLYEVAGETYVGCRPSPEYNGGVLNSVATGADQTIKVKGSATWTLSNAEGEKVVIKYDEKGKTLSVDRTESGICDFSDKFACTTTAPVHRKLTSIRVISDKSSVEIFGNNGEVCLTNLVFPKSPLTTITKLKK